MTTSRWGYAICQLMPLVLKGRGLSCDLVLRSSVGIVSLQSVELILLYCKSLIQISRILLRGRLLAGFSCGQSHFRCSGSLAMLLCVFLFCMGVGFLRAFTQSFTIALWISPVGRSCAVSEMFLWKVHYTLGVCC